METKFLLPIATLIFKLKEEFHLISEERKEVLKVFAEAIQAQLKSLEKAQIIVICTHNSRRSQLGELWLKAAAKFYEVENISAFSGGTEATAFHPNMVDAIERAGFLVNKKTEGINPVYEVSFEDDNSSCQKYFSKKYEDKFNPQKDFIAVMVCSEADGGCPFVAGSTHRISLPYRDPKEFDNTKKAPKKYDEKVKEIGREILYVFSLMR